jgi:hypothetical protein
MDKLLKIASILDKSGHYELSDTIYNKVVKSQGILAAPRVPGGKKLIEIKPPVTKDPRAYIDNSKTYAPPVEYYDGVDANKYNEFGNFQFKNRNIPQPNRFKFDGNTKVMDGSMYFDNPYTPKEILDLRKQLAPTNFRNELKRYESGDVMISSSNPQNFATSLWEYARRNNTSSSLVNSFDAFADAGAMYKGQSIKDIPELQELYKIIRNSPRMFSMTEISEMLKDMEAGK